MSQTPNPMQRKSVLPEFLKNMFGGQGQQEGPMTPQTSPNLGMGAGISAGGEIAAPASRALLMDKIRDNISPMTPPMFPPRGMQMGQDAMNAQPSDETISRGLGSPGGPNGDKGSMRSPMNFQQHGMDPRKRFGPMMMTR